MTYYRPGPRLLALALGAVREELAPDTLLAEVQSVWMAAVGETIAAAAGPSSERAGVLTVSCSAAVWAQELDLMSVPVLERLNGLLRRGQITRLRCVTSPLR